MPAFLPHKILNNHFLLTAERMIYWEEQQAIIISDMHMGKSGHFRKNGIAIPSRMFRQDMQRLLAGLQYFKPEQLIIVGDLFHSSENNEWPFFQRWVTEMPGTSIHLVRGNHDILHDTRYHEAGITIHETELSVGDFSFVHDFSEVTSTNEKFVFTGHVHPAVVIKGNGKQSLRLPCFYFAEKHAILPSFGSFTGYYTIEPAKTDQVFVITGTDVIQVQ